jgi:CRP/FNR family cyclic AMP-dependent transcriptional regulator
MQDFLATISPYSILDDQGLQALTNIAIRRNHRKNRVIIRQGDETNNMFILLQGQMRVYVEDEQGKQLTVRMLKSGDSFGEVALIGEFPRTASVETVSDCTVAAFSRGNYLAFLRDHPDITLALAKSLANLVRDTTEELSSIALSDVCGRISHIFNKYADQQEGEMRVPRFTHREIAGMIGSSREMVSKILKELEKAGYLAVAAKHYVIERPLPENWHAPE